jgi:hypothetical protein
MVLTEHVRKVIPSLTTSRPVWDAISLVTLNGSREDISQELFDGFIGALLSSGGVHPPSTFTLSHRRRPK